MSEFQGTGHVAAVRKALPVSEGNTAMHACAANSCRFRPRMLSVYRGRDSEEAIFISAVAGEATDNNSHSTEQCNGRNHDETSSSQRHCRVLYWLCFDLVKLPLMCVCVCGKLSTRHRAIKGWYPPTHHESDPSQGRGPKGAGGGGGGPLALRGRNEPRPSPRLNQSRPVAGYPPAAGLTRSDSELASAP